MQNVADSIQGSFYSKFQALAEKETPTAWERFLGAFTGVSVQGLVNERVLKTFSGLDEPFNEVFGQYGRESLTGYANGLLEKERSTEDQAKSTAENIATAFSSAMQIHSPLSCLHSTANGAWKAIPTVSKTKHDRRVTQ